MKKKKRAVGYTVAAVILSAVLLFAGIQALRIYLPQSSAARSFEHLKSDSGLDQVSNDEIIRRAQETASEPEREKEVDEGIARLAEQNSDFVGWLSIDGTVIDYPVMKSPESDPEYYLHRDFDREYSYSGTLFIGEGCNADSTAFVVYGHNMSAGTMFGELDSYKSASYALDHMDIVFRTTAGNRVYRVFAAFESKIYPEGSDVFEYYKAVGRLDQGAYSATVRNIRELSLISTGFVPAYPMQIMFLSTCSYHTEDGRFVVAAYRVA